MKKILVPCDFSRQSRAAVEVAVQVALKNNGEILLLHVLPIPTLYTGTTGEPFADPVFFADWERDSDAELKKIKNQIDPKVRVTTETIYGDFTMTVTRMSEENKVDMVVMGTSGSSGFTEFVIGSNTEKIVRFSKVPVLAVHKAMDVASVKNILVPATGELNQLDFINKLKELQQFFQATLHILLINTPNSFVRDLEAHATLSEYIKHYKLTGCKTYFKSYLNETDGIMDFASSEDIDMIAMATHARKGLAHLFSGSKTEKVVNHFQGPIWTYHLKH